MRSRHLLKALALTYGSLLALLVLIALYHLLTKALATATTALIACALIYICNQGTP